MKEKCKCKKDAVIIEDKIYYCGPCYVNKFVRVRKGLQSKPLDTVSYTHLTLPTTPYV